MPRHALCAQMLRSVSISSGVYRERTKASTFPTPLRLQREGTIVYQAAEVQGIVGSRKVERRVRLCPRHSMRGKPKILVAAKTSCSPRGYECEIYPMGKEWLHTLQAGRSEVKLLVCLVMARARELIT
jgi:hypothetical protein